MTRKAYGALSKKMRGMILYLNNLAPRAHRIARFDSRVSRRDPYTSIDAKV